MLNTYLVELKDINMNEEVTVDEVLESLKNEMKDGFNVSIVNRYTKTHPQFKRQILAYSQVLIKNLNKEEEPPKKKEIVLELFRVGGGTFQVRVNGEVDPRLNDYKSATGVMMKARLFYPETKINVPFELKEYLVDNGPPVNIAEEKPNDK